MKFEIQKRSFQQLQRDAQDALVVVWTRDTAMGKDPLSVWVNQALKAGDFEHKSGSVLQSYGMEGFKARRLVLVSAGDGRAAGHSAALKAAWASLKGAKIQRLGVHWAADVPAEHVRQSALALAEASYTYTTTLSQAQPRALAQVLFSA